MHQHWWTFLSSFSLPQLQLEGLRSTISSPKKSRQPDRQMLLMVLRLKTINPVYLDYIIQNKLGIVTTNVGIITTNIVQAT